MSVWVPPQLFVSPKLCGTQLLRTAPHFPVFYLRSQKMWRSAPDSLNGTIYTQSEKHVLNDFDHGKRIRFTTNQRTSYALDLLKKNMSLNKLNASSKTSSDQWICLVCFCFWYKFVLGRSCWVLLGKIWSMYLNKLCFLLRPTILRNIFCVVIKFVLLLIIIKASKMRKKDIGSGLASCS